jgi:hypothetical protein
VVLVGLLILVASWVGRGKPLKLLVSSTVETLSACVDIMEVKGWEAAV